jgi:hypothetical protein
MSQKTIAALFVLLISSFILTASIGYSAEPYLGTDPVISVVDSYFQAVGAKDFKTAYYLRTECWRDCTSLKAFSASWDDNVTTKLVDRAACLNSECKAVVKVRIYTEDNHCGWCQGTAPRYYSGKVYLVYEKSRRAWKIDRIAIDEEINGINFGK